MTESSVQAALEAHQRGDSRLAVQILREVWRSLRSVRLGDAIVTYARRLAPTDTTEPPTLDDPREIEKWIRQAKKAPDAAKRLRKLSAEYGPDPCLTDILVALLRPRLHARNNAVQKLLFELLEEQGDPRMFPMLQALPNLEMYRDDIRYGRVEIPGTHEHNQRLAHLYQLRFEPEWKERRLPRDDRLRLSRMLGDHVPDPREAEQRLELWKAVLAAPRDLAPRLVYADHLTQAGDPRGSFIVLQVGHAEGELDAARRARMEELFTSYRERWFSRIEPALTLKPEHLRGGFLALARIKASRPAVLQSVGGSREWNLVDEAVLSSPAHVAILLDPAFKSLRTVRGLGTVEDAAGLSLVHPRLRELYFAPSDVPDLGTVHTSYFTRLHTLGLTAAQRPHLQWFLANLARPLKVLRLTWRGVRLDWACDWLAEDRIPGTRTELHIRAGGSSRLEVHSRTNKSGGWDLAVQLRGAAEVQQSLLEHLPPGRVRIVRSTNADVRKAAAARFPTARVDKPWASRTASLPGSERRR